MSVLKTPIGWIYARFFKRMLLQPCDMLHGLVTTHTDPENMDALACLVDKKSFVAKSDSENIWAILVLKWWWTWPFSVSNQMF